MQGNAAGPPWFGVVTPETARTSRSAVFAHARRARQVPDNSSDTPIVVFLPNVAALSRQCRCCLLRRARDSRKPCSNCRPRMSPAICRRRLARYKQPLKLEGQLALPGPLARARSRDLPWRAMACCSTRRCLPAPAAALSLHRSAQRIHEVDDFRRLALARRLDLLAGLLFLQQLL